MKPDSTAVDQYLTTVPKPKKQELERIRAIVRKVAPEAIELISYMMPAFKYKNKPLVYYAAFKEHLSLFPTSGPTEGAQGRLTGLQGLERHHTIQPGPSTAG